MTLNKKYLALTIVLLHVEIIIAILVDDAFVRPYLGDTIATILVFAMIKTVTQLKVNHAALIALAISYGIESAQYFGLLTALGWDNNELAILLLGHNFSWGDIVAYTAGAGIIMGFNRYMAPSKTITQKT